jgi:hypothetical protein
VVFEKSKHCIELEAQKHQKLVNSVIIYFIPMEIENIDESFKPLLLSLSINTS